VQLLERPHGALHEGEIHRLVIVLEIDPARGTGDVIFPVRRELLHRGAAMLVEAGHAVFQDLETSGDAEFLFRLQLGGQTMAIPAETTIDDLAAHRLIARHQVLHEAGDEMAIMGKAVGEGRSVIEDEFRRALLPALLDRAFENRVLLPPRADRFLDLREGRRRLGGGIDGLRLCHGECLYSGGKRQRIPGRKLAPSIAPLRQGRHPQGAAQIWEATGTVVRVRIDRSCARRGRSSPHPLPQAGEGSSPVSVSTSAPGWTRPLPRMRERVRRGS
jgi:hypothetical protein